MTLSWSRLIIFYRKQKNVYFNWTCQMMSENHKHYDYVLLNNVVFYCLKIDFMN